MGKSCSNCYWKYSEAYALKVKKYCAWNNEEIKENMCKNHSYKCSCRNELAEYKYKDEYVCKECLLDMLGVETYTVTHYTLDDEYLGSDDDIDEVIKNLGKDIEELE